MQQRRVGTTGLTVSRLGLGTMTWGRDTDEHEARDQLIAFAEAGGTLARHRGRLRRRRVRGAARHAASATSSRATTSCSRPRPGSARAAAARVTDTSRGHLLAALDALAAPARRRPRRPVAGARLVRRHPARGDPGGAGPRGRAPAGRRTSGSRTTPAGRPRRPRPGSGPCPAGRRWPRTQVEYSLLNRARRARGAARRGRRSASACCPWSPLGRGVLTGKYRTGTPVGLPRRVDALRELRRRLPRRARRRRSSRRSPGPPTAWAGRRSRSRSPGSATGPA